MKMNFKLMATLILFLGAITSKAQTEVQKQRLKATAAEFIGSYNTGDTAKYRLFLVKHLKDQPHLSNTLTRFGNTFRSIGKVKVMAYDYLSATSIAISLQEERYEFWWKFTVVTDEAQQFLSRTVLPLAMPEVGLLSGKLSVSSLQKETDSYIVTKLGDHFSGNVWIGKDERTLYQKSFGNDHAGKPNTENTKFDLASVGKMFTAISILQLRDENHLKLSDKVEKFLPNLQNKAVAAITLQQLLTHTAGMGDFFENPLYEKMKDSLNQAVRFLPFIEQDQLVFEPGKDWRYSNTGFALLALIVEKASGSSFADYVEHRIFKPAGMKNSIVGSGAGGGSATVKDMRFFAHALQHQLLLKKETQQELFSYTVNGKYGYGTEHHLLGKENIVGHSGGTENECLEFNLYTKSGYLVIILSNSEPPFGHYLANKIKQLLIRI